MKLGVFTCLLGNLPLEEALKYFSSFGVEMVEIGCGGYPGNSHANPDILLNDETKLAEFKALIAKYNLEISALSCHANPVHPNKALAADFDKAIRDKNIVPLPFKNLCKIIRPRAGNPVRVLCFFRIARAPGESIDSAYSQFFR